MAKHISEFQGDYRFLSNFYICDVMHEGILYRNSEAAFQAAKCLDKNERKRFSWLSPSRAKALGRKVQLRPGWDNIRIDIMREILRDKFTRNPHLKQLLLETGDAELTEGNTWHDTFWGVDLRTGQGENHLGKLLMELRESLR